MSRQKLYFLMNLSVALFFLTLLIWAANAQIDEAVRGVGKVVPSSQLQIVQSLEGGIVAEINVKQGDRVEKDQPLVRIDDTRFSSSLDESRAQQIALQASVARLRAEVSGAGGIDFPDKLCADAAKVCEEQRSLFIARRAEVNEIVAALQRSLSLNAQELAINRPLAVNGIVSKLDVIRLERAGSDLSGQISEKRNGYRARAGAELSEAQAKLSALTENMRGSADRVSRAVLRAPMNGIVKQLFVATQGGVVQPGEKIMEIVPVDDSMLVEARISPADVAFVRTGMPAVIKITAFDFALYGALTGVVDFISADAVEDKERKEVYFRLLIRTDRDHFVKDGVKLPVTAGMIAEADVITGKKTVLQYLTTPFTRIKSRALSER